MSPDLNIRDIIQRAWQTKFRVILICIVVAIAYGLYVVIDYQGQSTTTRYSQVYDLNFEGLSDGQFPDGSPFLLSDITGNTVVRRVHEQHNLEAEHGLSLARFQSQLSVEPYSPNYRDIIADYRSQLSSNMASSDIATLEDRLRDDLMVAQSGAIRLALHQPAGEALPSSVAYTLLDDITQAWAERAVEERGVLNLDMPIYTARIFDEERFEQLDYLIAIELLLENIQLISDNINTLRQQPNAARVQDPESGFNLEDLAKALEDVEEYDLRQLIDPVRELGLSRDEQTIRLYYQRQLRQLALEQDTLERRANVTRELMNLSMGQGSDTPLSTQPLPQIGDAFLDRLVDLAAQSEDEAFRQSMSRQVLNYQNEALDIAQRMEEIEQTLNTIQGVNFDIDSDDIDADEEQALRLTYADEIEATLPNILATLRDYTDTVGRLHQRLGEQASGGIDALIQPQADSSRTETDRMLERSHIINLFFLLLLTGTLSLLTLMAYDQYRQTKPKN